MRCTVQVTLETLGLSLAEVKAVPAGLQEGMVAAQAAEYVAAHDRWPECHKPLWHKGRTS